MDPETLTFIRVLIGDTETPYTFSDSQIESVYTSVGENPYLTGAILLETAAAKFAVQFVTLRTDDLQVSGADAAKILLERAKRLRDQAADDASTETLDHFEVVFPHDRGLYWEYEERARPWAF